MITPTVTNLVCKTHLNCKIRILFPIKPIRQPTIYALDYINFSSISTRSVPTIDIYQYQYQLLARAMYQQVDIDININIDIDQFYSTRK